MTIKTIRLRWIAAMLCGCGATFVAPAAVIAQPATFGDLGIVDSFDPAGESNLVTISSQFTAATADRPAVLMITARIAPGWHVFAITQPSGGPQATKIRLTASPDFRQIGPFRAFPPPKTHVDQQVWPGLELQEHEGEVTWYAPIAVAQGVDPAKLEIEGKIAWQVCKESCIPQNATFSAHLGNGVPIGPIDAFLKPVELAPLPQPTVAGSYQAEDSEVKLTGHVEPAMVRPGESARLVITATPSLGWHVYAYAPYDNKPGSKRTLITFESTSGLVPQLPKTEAEARLDDSVPSFGPMYYHDGRVTWVTQIDVPANAPAGDYPIRGLIGYQACEYRSDGRGSCELARAVHFQGTLQVGTGAGSANAPLTFAAAKSYADAALAASQWSDLPEVVVPPLPLRGSPTDVANGEQQSSADEQLAVDPNAAPIARALDNYDLRRVRVEASGGSMLYYLALAFVGGIILNLMPCVLPVIGLKVMSFVQQAGKSRAHALVLNLWFAAGIVLVFIVLGLLAVLPQLGLSEDGLGWGGQFGNTTFNVVMASIVFAMALSLLGVWEVPIPGFFGRGTAQELAAKEGPLGAFSKGVITTILATPCTAPFMATAIAWAVMQPLAKTLAVFASLGLGMASPYLVVGVFPELLRFLPKPGAWMETFKQFTGFVLLATVIFILSFVEPAAVVPTIAFLLGLGMACWLLPRAARAVDWEGQLRIYTLSSAVLLLFGAFSFAWLYPRLTTRFEGQMARADASGEWQPFSLEKLKKVAVDAGKTVLVDFSADWCISCKSFEATVLHTEPVEKAIADSGAVTMYADFTRYPPEIRDTLHALRSQGVPVIAVFPGDRPYEPIVFKGGYTKDGLIDALEKATGRRLRNDGSTVADAATASAPLN